MTIEKQHAKYCAVEKTIVKSSVVWYKQYVGTHRSQHQEDCPPNSGSVVLIETGWSGIENAEMGNKRSISKARRGREGT